MKFGAAPKIYVDLNNADRKGRVQLNCAGTLLELARQVQLREGLVLTLYADDGDELRGLSELRGTGIEFIFVRTTRSFLRIADQPH